MAQDAQKSMVNTPHVSFTFLKGERKVSYIILTPAQIILTILLLSFTTKKQPGSVALKIQWHSYFYFY